MSPSIRSFLVRCAEVVVCVAIGVAIGFGAFLAF